MLYAENVADDDVAMSYSLECPSDSEYTVELEHEWLRQRYGMNNTNASSRALMNLEKALRASRIDRLTYENEKSCIEDQISRIYDDSKTCSNG